MYKNVDLTGGLIFLGQLLLDLSAAGMLRETAYKTIQVHAMKAWLEDASFRHEVENDPDVFVTYHTSTQDSLFLNINNFGYGYPGGWGYSGYYGYGYGMATATVSSFESGTLVVDAWDAETEKMVWRGIATNITVYENPDKMLKKVDVALKKIVKKWQRIKKKG